MNTEIGEKLLEIYCISCQETIPFGYVEDTDRIVKAIYRKEAIRVAGEIEDINFLKKCKDCYKRNSGSLLEEEKNRKREKKLFKG